jgi:hypothetical protein
MNANDAIKNTIDTADMICGAYLEDLSNEEAMKRPHAGCNHINWQLGHLISSDNMMCNGCVPDSLPALPEGFAEKYSKETASNDNAADFVPKTELMELYRNQRKAIKEVVEGLSAEQLNAASPENFQSYAPTVGAVFNMLGSHWLMHAGQWVIVRRELGREIVI